MTAADERAGVAGLVAALDKLAPVYERLEVEAKPKGGYRVINPDGDAELGNWVFAECWWKQAAEAIAELPNLRRVLLAALADPDAVARLTRENAELRRCVQIGMDLTNHHNAALCPYCNPYRQAQIDKEARLTADLASALAASQAMVVQLDKANRTIASRERRIARIVAALDQARSEDFLTEYDKGPQVVLSDALAPPPAEGGVS